MTVAYSKAKDDVDITLSENVTSYFCNHFSIISSYLANYVN